MTLLPAFLDLRGEAVSVVGGGGVALRRTRSLLEAGARVRVIAPERHPDFGTLAVEWVARAYRSGDLHGARVVVAATDSDEVNAEVAREARAGGAWVCDAARAERGNLRFGAVAARAGVQVAVNTGRELPMLSQALTRRIAALLPSPEQLEDWVRAREAALGLGGPEKQAALERLRGEIQMSESLRLPGDATPASPRAGERA